MMDNGRKYADAKLLEMAKSIAEDLEEVSFNAIEKIKTYLEKHQSVIDQLDSQYENGEITESEYETQLKVKLTTGKEWEKIRNEVAKDMVTGQEKAVAATAAGLSAIYLYTRNFTNSEINKVLKKKVKDRKKRRVRLNKVKHAKNFAAIKINRAKNFRWHNRKIESVIRQGMKRGWGTYKIAKQIERVSGMDKNTAIRTVRTAVTRVESNARMDSFYEAESKGINTKKTWDAVKDDRTRTSHRIIDGETIPLNEYFSNGLFEPGDMSGDPEEYYNCRCGLKGTIEGYEILGSPKAPSGMGKYEWVGQKPISKHYGESTRHYNERVAQEKKNGK